MALTDAEHYPPCDFVRAIVDASEMCSLASDPILSAAVDMRARADWTRPAWFEGANPDRGEARFTIRTIRGKRATRVVHCVSRGATARGEFEAR